tara:strand:- start:472 stop:693 length:222 start_codon:yes stop_codon:yes gene_type:complete
MKEALFVLVISMWGNDGSINHPIGQITFQKPMSSEQCNWLISDGQWKHQTNNEFYFLVAQCYPVSCTGQEKCT